METLVHRTWLSNFFSSHNLLSDINLETILVAGVNDIRKKSFHSYWTLTVALLNGLRSMYDATMRFNDFGSPTHVRRLCGNFVELFEGKTKTIPA